MSRYGFTIEPGWPVYSADDLWLGEVKDINDNYILVSPRPHHRVGRKLYIPISAVQAFESGRVIVNYDYERIVGDERYCRPPAEDRPRGETSVPSDEEHRGETEGEQHPELYSP